MSSAGSAIVDSQLQFRVLYSTVEFDAMYNPMAFVSQHEWMYWTFDHFALLSKFSRPMILHNSKAILVIYILFIIHQPGKFLPREYTRFKFDPAKIAKLKRDHQYPRMISNPIPQRDSKRFEITMVETSNHSGSRLQIEFTKQTNNELDFVLHDTQRML